MTCVVPGCKSNYHSESGFTSVFSFPIDEDIREKWFRAIPRAREDYEMHKQLKVCIIHFKNEDIDRNYEFFDGTKMVEVPRKKISLNRFAVPSIFPNCPDYLTDITVKPQRLSRALANKEEKMMQSAYKESLIDNKENDAKFFVATLDCIISKLNQIELPNGWLCHRPNPSTILFLKIHFYGEITTIDRSIIIDQNLICKALYKETHKIQLSYNVLNGMRLLEKIIQEVEIFEVAQIKSVSSSVNPVNTHIENAIMEISSAINKLEPSNNSLTEYETGNTDAMRIRLNFLLDQLKYLILDKYSRRFSILTQVFCLKLQGISPASYRLIQSSNCLILPHERNLLRIRNSIGLQSEYTKIIKEIATTFKHLERHVILQMDEVHIRSDAAYKGGRVIGSIDNPEDPPTTVFSIMISSLAARFSTIVRLIPLGSSSAEKLYPIIKSTIYDIEACDLFVEALCTDNYPLNVRLYKLFSADNTLVPKVTHPCNPERSLILFFDIVHIIKCIRNNWLNLKDYERTFIFPKFEECLLEGEKCINSIKSNKTLFISVSTAIISTRHFTSKSVYPELCYAPFQDVRNLFTSDKCNILKRAPRLTAKACWPSTLERQNVSFALKIFHETTSAGLLSWKMENNIVNINQTVEFLNLINKVWKTFNVNWVGKDIRFNDDYSAPIYPDDFRLQFLRNVVSWLDSWIHLPFSHGKLTPQTFTSFRHTCEALPMLVKRLTEHCGYQYLLTSRIQNDALEHHFGLYRQMSGSHYQISFTQILESERRLQLSNILKVFAIKCKVTSDEKPVSLKEYISQFSDNNDVEEQLDFEIELYINKLNEISRPEIDVGQIDCLVYIAGYAVFSYLKKSNGCPYCQDFLTTDKSLEVNNDVGSQYTLIDLVDRGSLKYPSRCVVDCVCILYEIFIKIDNCNTLNEEFYLGQCRTKLVQLSIKMITDKYSDMWNDWCRCNVWNCDVLKKLCVTWSNCILSKRVQNYNTVVLKRDNTKLKKYN